MITATTPSAETIPDCVLVAIRSRLDRAAEQQRIARERTRWFGRELGRLPVVLGPQRASAAADLWGVRRPCRVNGHDPRTVVALARCAR